MTEATEIARYAAVRAKFFPPTRPIVRGPLPPETMRRIEAKARAVQRALDKPLLWPMQIIAEEVAMKHGLPSWKEFRSKRQGRKLVAARWECWWRCRNETENSLPAIGRFFGGFDHTTVLHGIRMHEKRTAAG